MKNENKLVNHIAILALMLAMEIVLGQLTQIPLLSKQYNLGFLPVAVSAYFLGIPAAVTVAALGDLIGALLFPTGPYFPGFTITAALCGLVYGLFLKHSSLQLIWRVLLAVFCSLLLNWVLNSLWLSILYSSNGRSYFGWLAIRGTTYLIEFPLQVILIMISLKALEKLPPSLLHRFFGGKD